MRLFVAIWPTPAVISQLAGIVGPARAGIRWTTEDQWHVTLRFLGQVGDEELQGVNDALVGLGSVGPPGPVTAVAGPALERLGPSVLCLPVAGVDGVAASVVALTSNIGTSSIGTSSIGTSNIGTSSIGTSSIGTSSIGTSEMGLPPADRPFRGHLTMARAARGVTLRPDRPVPFSAFSAFSASWPVTEVTLVATTLHPAGARYDIIGRYPLGGPRMTA